MTSRLTPVCKGIRANTPTAARGIVDGRISNRSSISSSRAFISQSVTHLGGQIDHGAGGIWLIVPRKMGGNCTPVRTLAVKTALSYPWTWAMVCPLKMPVIAKPENVNDGTKLVSVLPMVPNEAM